MADSDDEDNIYISEDFQEDKLITYLEEKRVNKKVSFKLYIYL